MMKFLPLATGRKPIAFALLVGVLAAAAAGHARGSDARLRAQLLHAAGPPADTLRLEQVARQLGVPGLERALRGSNATLQLAALAAAPLAPQSWQLLPSVVHLLRVADPGVRRAAEAAARRMSEDLRPATLQRHEELPATLTELLVAPLLELARDTNADAEARSAAILVLAQARDRVAVQDALLLPLLDSPAPPVRRAAVQLFAVRPGAAAITRLSRLLGGDADHAVATGAAAVLCAQLPPPHRRTTRGGVLDALRAAGADARLRQIAASASTSIDELIDIARCLWHLGDRRTYRNLLRRSAPVRRAVGRLH